MLICHSCQRLLTGEIQKGRTYYSCKRNNHTCDQKYIREDRLDQELSTILLKNIGFKALLKEFSILIKDDFEEKKTYREKEESHIKKLQKELESKLDRLVDLRINGEISSELFQTKKIDIENELVVVKERKYKLDESVSNLHNKLINFIELFELGLYQIKNNGIGLNSEFVRMLCSNLEIYNKKIKTTGYHPVVVELMKLNKSCRGSMVDPIGFEPMASTLPA